MTGSSVSGQERRLEWQAQGRRQLPRHSQVSERVGAVGIRLHIEHGVVPLALLVFDHQPDAVQGLDDGPDRDIGVHDIP